MASPSPFITGPEWIRNCSTPNPPSVDVDEGVTRQKQGDSEADQRLCRRFYDVDNESSFTALARFLSFVIVSLEGVGGPD